ncbi:MAG: hypothetical protein HQL07_10025 [Nitrospirae bacterium]|nr:hypothetical protein [Magnetococcales bacterium]HAT49052.1 hypothetical protein [Alphaproteobacteria bacterium]
MHPLMISILASLLLVALVGCSNPSDKTWDQKKSADLTEGSDQEGMLGTITRIFSSSIEAVSLNEDLFLHEPVPSDILRQEIPTEKLQKLDRDHLKEQAKLLQKHAADAGMSLDQENAPDLKSIREMGERFGLSDERIAELEALATAKAKKVTVDESASPNASHPKPPIPSPGTTAVPFPDPPMDDPQTAINPEKTSSQGYSSEMQEIINRREERLREARKANPNP